MNRVYDLSPRVSGYRILLGVAGVVQIANGTMNLLGGEHLVMAAISICVGLLLLPGSFLVKRLSRFIVDFSEDAVDVARGHVKKRLSWEMIAEIKLFPMSADFITRDGFVQRLSLSELGYADVQVIKPQIFATIRDFSKAKEISLSDERKG